jgi:hypothetical protein
VGRVLAQDADELLARHRRDRVAGDPAKLAGLLAGFGRDSEVVQHQDHRSRQRRPPRLYSKYFTRKPARFGYCKEQYKGNVADGNIMLILCPTHRQWLIDSGLINGLINRFSWDTM